MSNQPATRTKNNISRGERIASIAAGGALAGLGVVLGFKTKKGLWPGIGLAAAGGTLVFRGASGHCAVKQALQSTGSQNGPMRIERTLSIPGKPPEEVYERWRNLENLPQLVDGLESVKETGNRSHWKIKGPAGAPLTWDAEITNDRPGRLIQFRSVPGSILNISGTVRFKRKQGGGTKVHLSLNATTPGGAIGEAIRNVVHFKPEEMVESGLQAFRDKIEQA